jgi:hypothetical protein
MGIAIVYNLVRDFHLFQLELQECSAVPRHSNDGVWELKFDGLVLRANDRLAANSFSTVNGRKSRFGCTGTRPVG